MITICLSEANFEYDIHSLVKAFYAAEEVKVSADREKICRLERDCAPLFHMEVCYLCESEREISHKNKEEKRDCIELILYHPPKESGQAYEDGGYLEEVRRAVAADFSDRVETKNQLKQCLYQMLSDYTGRKLPWGTLTGIRPVKIPMSMLEQGKRETEIKTYMSDTYYASQPKIDLSVEIAKRELELLKQIDYKQGYSLYVGIPFCPSICSYCSFSSSPIGIWEGKVNAYLDALEREIDFLAHAMRDRELNTIYIGGGTPTTLSPEQLKRLLGKLQHSFDFSNLLEYTVEAGRPDSITRDKLEVLCSYGITRISINPQTMNQATLDLIGRRHTVEQTIESYQLAREMGFDNINMDLIVGLPGEKLCDVKNTMEQIKALAPDNLTIHSLAIKRAARLKMFSEDYQGMEMENNWETIDLTARYARELGLMPYYLYRQKNMAGNFENVGYARSGKAGLYNILIMEEKQSILALGAGASSKYVFEAQEAEGIRVERTENVKDITHYLERIEEMIERKREGIRMYMQ